MGYQRIRGELLQLGHRVSSTSIRNLLRRHRIPPAPRRSGLTWRRFLKAHGRAILACDYFTVETVFLKRFYILFFLELASRRILAENRGRLHQEQGPSRQLAAQGGQDHAVGGPPVRWWCSSSEDEQLLAKDEEFQIAITGWAVTEDEEVDQQAKEGIEDCQQHGRAE